MNIFEEATKQWNGKPILIVEDIHTVMEPKGSSPVTAKWIAGKLINLSIKGCINVIYTSSDNMGVTLLKSGE